MLPYQANNDVYDVIVDIHSVLCTDDSLLPDGSGKLQRGGKYRLPDQQLSKLGKSDKPTIATQGTKVGPKDTPNRQGVSIEEVPDESIVTRNVINDDDIVDENFILIDRKSRETLASRSSFRAPMKN